MAADEHIGGHRGPVRLRTQGEHGHHRQTFMPEADQTRRAALGGGLDMLQAVIGPAGGAVGPGEIAADEASEAILQPRMPDQPFEPARGAGFPPRARIPALLQAVVGAEGHRRAVARPRPRQQTIASRNYCVIASKSPRTIWSAMRSSPLPMIALTFGLAAILLGLAAMLRDPEYDEGYTAFVTSPDARPTWPAVAFRAADARAAFRPAAAPWAIAGNLRRTDVHPPLYFWTVWAWRRVWGPNLTITRML